jgi:hypothetical protein
VGRKPQRGWSSDRYRYVRTGLLYIDTRANWAADTLSILIHTEPTIDTRNSMRPIRWKTGVALGHTVLHLDGAAHRVDHAPELNEDAVSRPLDYPSVMQRDGRIDQIASERAHPRKGALLVSAGKFAVSGYICRKDGRKFPGFWHCYPSATRQTSTIA